jgi:hypothetical protein
MTAREPYDRLQDAANRLRELIAEKWEWRAAEAEIRHRFHLNDEEWQRALAIYDDVLQDTSRGRGGAQFSYEVGRHDERDVATGYNDPLDRMCVCGHRKGVHDTRGIRCQAYSMDPEELIERGIDPATADCGCVQFKAAPRARSAHEQSSATSSLPFAIVRHGADNVPVLLGGEPDEDGRLTALNVVDGGTITFAPDAIIAAVNAEPAAVYYGIRAEVERERGRMAAEVGTQSMPPVRKNTLGFTMPALTEAFPVGALVSYNGIDYVVDHVGQDSKGPYVALRSRSGNVIVHDTDRIVFLEAPREPASNFPNDEDARTAIQRALDWPIDVGSGITFHPHEGEWYMLTVVGFEMKPRSPYDPTPDPIVIAVGVIRGYEQVLALPRHLWHGIQRVSKEYFTQRPDLLREMAAGLISVVESNSIENLPIFYDTPEARSIANAVRSLGILPEHIIPLGPGQFGIAARLSSQHDGRVLKITSDESEVRSAASLIGKSLPNVVEFYSAHFVTGVHVRGLMGIKKNGEPVFQKRRVGVIIEEYAGKNEDGPHAKQVDNEVSITTLHVKNTLKTFPMELAKLGHERARRRLWEASEMLEGSLRARAEEIREGKRRHGSLNVKPDLMILVTGTYPTSARRGISTGILDIANAIGQLRAEGVYAVDAHGGNFAWSRVGERYKLYDIGLSSAPPGHEPTDIPPKVAGSKKSRRSRKETVLSQEQLAFVPPVAREDVVVPEISGEASPMGASEAAKKGEITHHWPGLTVPAGLPFKGMRPRGFRFQWTPEKPKGLTAFPEVRPVLITLRDQIPSLESIRTSAIFAGLTAHAQTSEAEGIFTQLADEFWRMHGALPPIEVFESFFSNMRGMRSLLYESVPVWAPIVQHAMRSKHDGGLGLRDRELRRYLWVDRIKDKPHGLALAKMSFALMLLGQNVLCLDTWIVRRMYGLTTEKEEKAVIDQWKGHTELALTRYEQVEDAFLKGNPWYHPNDPIGRSRAQWMSWEWAIGEAAPHRPWLELAKKLLARPEQMEVPF